MGQVFGKIDPTATIQQAGQTVADPNKGLSAGNLFARKALAGSLGGLGKGLGQMNGPQGNYSPPIQTPQAPMVDPSYFGVGKPKNPFFGG